MLRRIQLRSYLYLERLALAMPLLCPSAFIIRIPLAHPFNALSFWIVSAISRAALCNLLFSLLNWIAFSILFHLFNFKVSAYFTRWTSESHSRYLCSCSFFFCVALHWIASAIIAFCFCIIFHPFFIQCIYCCCFSAAACRENCGQRKIFFGRHDLF